MRKKYFIYTMSFLILFCLSWFCYEKFLAKEPDREIMVRCISALCITVPLTIIFNFSIVFHPEKSIDSTYICHKYGWLVNKNFAKNKKLRLKVFHVLEHYDLQNYKKALKKLEQLRPLCDCSADRTALALIEGMCYTAARTPDKAIPYLLSMVNENPLESTAWALLAFNYIEINDLQKAKEALETGDCYDSENQWIFAAAAFLMFKCKVYSAVITNGNFAEELGCQAAMLYLIMAISYKNLHRDEQYKAYKDLYTRTIRYEEAMDARLHLTNARAKLHRKYLKSL